MESAPKPKPKKKISPRFIFEPLAIFCSVLLAFAAEQWRSELNDRKRANDILSLVKSELTYNLNELQGIYNTREPALAYYIDAIASYQDTGDFPSDFSEPVSPKITTVAYQLASESGVVSVVEPQTLIAVARAYEALDNVSSNIGFLDNRNSQIRFQDGEQYLSGFIYYTNRAIYNEPIAIEQVRAALDVL